MFLDETAAGTKMARRHGRAPRGERSRIAVAFGHWKTIAGLAPNGLTASTLVDGPTTGARFRDYVEHTLAPLQARDTAALDILPAQQVSGIHERLEAAGAGRLDRLAYSPNSNAVELAFAKLRAILRAEATRTSSDLSCIDPVGGVSRSSER